MFWRFYNNSHSLDNKKCQLFAKYKLPLDEQFFNAQHKYWIMMRFMRRVILRKYIKYQANEDLYGTPLQSKYTVELIHNKCIYKFSIHDLMRIIVSALTTCVHGYPSPKQPRNPYINKEFNYCQLLSIYVFAQTYAPRLLYEPIIMAYYRACFNINAFTNVNRRLLSIKCIEALVSKDLVVTTETIYHIVEMLNNCCNVFAKIQISKLADKQVLYNIFRPYLHLYYEYRMLQLKHSLKILKKALLRFALYNPMFGRDYYNFTEKKWHVDLRCMNIQDYLNVVFKEISQSYLQPIKNVYYMPKVKYDNPKTELVYMPRDAIYEPLL
jgi:hypothetical protein